MNRRIHYACGHTRIVQESVASDMEAYDLLRDAGGLEKLCAVKDIQDEGPCLKCCEDLG
jgi:hypothetical protein